MMPQKKAAECAVKRPGSESAAEENGKKPKSAKTTDDMNLKLVRSFPIRSSSDGLKSQNFYSDALSLTLSEKDDVIVADAGRTRLRVFDLFGKQKAEVFSTDLPTDVDWYPACVCCITGTHEVVVSHCFAYHGLVLTATLDYDKLSFVSQFSMENLRCWGMAYSHGRNQVVVAHEQYKKISRFDPKTWKPVSQFVTDGAPLYVALNADDTEVFVTTSDENRVEVYAEDGSYLDYYGTMGTRIGQFMGIAGLTVDKLGNCIVCDKGNHRLQLLTKERKWHRVNVDCGSLDFKSPTDIKITSSGQLCVLANNHVFVFELA